MECFILSTFNELKSPHMASGYHIRRLAGPWPSALCPSQESYFRFCNRNSPFSPLFLLQPYLLLHLPPPSLPDEYRIPTLYPTQSRGPLSSLTPALAPLSCPLPPMAHVPLQLALPAPSLLPFQKDQFPLSHPQQLASSPRPHFSEMPLPSYQQHLCCQIQADT